MSANRRAAREEGVVLLLVLVILVSTIATVYAFARTTVLDVVSMRRASDHARARLLAESGVRVALRALADDLASSDPLSSALETPRDAWALLGQRPIPIQGAGQLEVRVIDGGSRVDLNGLIDATGAAYDQSEPFLGAALARIIDGLPGRAEDKPYDPAKLAAAILDWIDADDTTADGADEARTYGRLQAKVQPLDRPLLDLGELAKVPGVDARLLGELRAYFTVQPLVPTPDRSGVNPNTAPPQVLGLIYLGTAGAMRLVSRDDVFEIMKLREEGKVFCPPGDSDRCVSFDAEIGRVGESIFPPLQLASSVFAITSRGRVDEAQAQLSIVVDRTHPAAPQVLEVQGR
ncbi:MAG: general secretion pathway protein GspK [Myxococcota bacterium]